MTYTYAITSKGQVTIPKEFRQKLGLDKAGKATFYLNKKGELVIAPPKTLEEVRALLSKPSGKADTSEKDRLIGRQLAKKYGVR